MVNIRFSNGYRVVHFTNEFGKYIIGGIASFMNEMYDEHQADTGFVHLYEPAHIPDIETAKYPGDRDILAVPYTEAARLSALTYDVAVVHFFGLSFLLEEAIKENQPLVYVVHSVPTTEPYDPQEPFGPHLDIQSQFERFCFRANAIVCISETEKRKLSSLYPQFHDKITVIPNGMKFNDNEPRPVRDSRQSFGFMGRLDYRKGLLDCVKAFRHVQGELTIACGCEDPYHLGEILLFIEGAKLENRVRFIGWCQGARKQRFLESLDALIVPSLYEPFGYVVLEAMNAGIPLICSNRGGIPEIVGPEYPYLFDPYEPGSLEAAILRFQNDDSSEIEKRLKLLAERKPLFSGYAMRSGYERLTAALSEGPLID